MRAIVAEAERWRAPKKGARPAVGGTGRAGGRIDARGGRGGARADLNVGSARC